MSHPVEKDSYQAVSDALMPLLNCDPHNHDPRSCPAVLAVMDALGAGSHPEHGYEVQSGSIVGPIDEWSGYRRDELAATHVRTVVTVRHEGPWTRVLPPGESA